VSDVDPGASFEIRDMEGRNLTSSITIGIDRDSRDRPWNTRSGSFNNLSFEYAGGPLGGMFTSTDTSSPASGSSVALGLLFHGRGRWGWVEQREGGKLPDYQKYRLGGISTVRGYDKDSIALIDPVTGDELGGEKMMIYNLEFRIPVLKEQGVLGVLFFDAGNVFDEDDTWTSVIYPCPLALEFAGTPLWGLSGWNMATSSIAGLRIHQAGLSFRSAQHGRTHFWRLSQDHFRTQGGLMKGLKGLFLGYSRWSSCFRLLLWQLKP